MANKNNSSKKSFNWDAVSKFCAFWSICVAGILFTVQGILKLVKANVSFGIIPTIVTILLVAATIIPGWRYSKRMPMAFRIVFWVAAILLIAFGAISLNI